VTKRAPKVIPLSKCVERSWEFQDFKATGHPYWELWNEIIHAVSSQIENTNRLRDVNNINFINSRPKDKESNRNDNE
jgi:hypothetical protein